MELKEFITSTLVEIAEGVYEAAPRYQELNGAVNPSKLSIVSTLGGDTLYSAAAKKPGSDSDYAYHLSTIEFEIGLTDHSNSEGKAGIGVAFAALGIGGSSKEETGASSITKVKFNIPVKLPTQSL